jgi:hypothetical protein
LKKEERRKKKEEEKEKEKKRCKGIYIHDCPAAAEFLYEFYIEQKEMERESSFCVVSKDSLLFM